MELIERLIRSIETKDFVEVFDEFKSDVLNFNDERQDAIIRTVSEKLVTYFSHRDEYLSLIRDPVLEEQIAQRVNDWEVNYYQVLNFCEKRSSVISDAGFEQMLWKGDLKRFGAIIYKLIDAGYLDSPKKNNGEINFSSLERTLLQHFKIRKGKTVTLKDYLNPNDEKFDDGFFRSLKITELNRNA